MRAVFCLETGGFCGKCYWSHLCDKVKLGFFLEGFLVLQRLLQASFWLEEPYSSINLEWSEIP